MNQLVNKEIRSLSWKQPYLFLMDGRFGKIETRAWPTNYRGLVLMCATKVGYSPNKVLLISGVEQTQRIKTAMYRTMGVDKDLIQMGMATHIGELVHCRQMIPEDEDRCFVQYQEGLWCHVYHNVQRIEPFQWKGTQGWKILNKEQKSLIKPI